MVWKSRRDAGASSAWPRIVGAIVPGLLIAGALLSGTGRRVAAGLYRRHIRALVADLGPSSSRTPAMTTPADPVADQVELTMTSEDAASDPGPPPTDIPLAEPDPPAEPAAAPFDHHAVPEEQLHEPPLMNDSGNRTTGSELSDSVAGDGSALCPAGFPIKGNGRSGIYHLPGAFAYDRTIPSICFRTPDAAERAGFRAARSRHS